MRNIINDVEQRRREARRLAREKASQPKDAECGETKSPTSSPPCTCKKVEAKPLDEMTYSELANQNPVEAIEKEAQKEETGAPLTEANLSAMNYSAQVKARMNRVS